LVEGAGEGVAMALGARFMWRRCGVAQLAIFGCLQLAYASRRRAVVLSTTTTTTWPGGYLDFNLTVYDDERCETPFTPYVGSAQEASKYTWRRHWTHRFCWDIIDTTPANPAIPPEREEKLNYFFSCDNPEGSGNGLVHYVYERSPCIGPRLHKMDEAAIIRRNLPSGSIQYYEPDANTASWGEPRPLEWRFVFPAMNKEVLAGFFKAKCTAWTGGTFAKFDRPIAGQQVSIGSHGVVALMPDCADFACQTPPCAGGRLSTDPIEGNVPYEGGIKTVTSRYGSSSRACGAQHLVTSLRRLVMAVVIVLVA
jgi:hypothetical protein